MLDLSVSSDVAKLQRTLSRIALEQMPFATSQALNVVAREAAATVTEALPQIFDRPTPFTRRSIATLAARKDNLVAVVLVKDKQAEYLRLEETGGARDASALVVPAAIRRNAYGNIPRTALATLRARAAAKGTHGTGIVYLPAAHVPAAFGSRVGGYFQRRAGTLLRLTGFVAEERYKPRFGFQQRVAARVAAAFPAALRRALLEALR